MSAQPQTTSDRIAKVMENSVAVVMLRMQGLPGHRKVPDTEIIADGEKLNTKHMSSPTLRLMPTAWATKFNQIHAKAEKLIDQASPPKSGKFDLPLPLGCHLIAGQRKMEIAQTIHHMVTHELNPLRDSFCAAFDEILEDRRKTLNNDRLWERMVGSLPTVKRLKANINLRFIILPFTFLNEAGRVLAEEMAQSVISGIAETIEDEADRLKEKLQKGQIFKEGSFTNLRQQFQMLKDFSFLADDSTLGSLEQVEQLMASNEFATELNQDVKHGGLGIVKKLSEVITQLSSEASQDAGGRFRRKIMVPTDDD